MDTKKIQRQIEAITQGLKIEVEQLEKEAEYFMMGYTKDRTEAENMKQGILSYTYREPLETIKITRRLEQQLQNTRQQNKEENEIKYDAYLEFKVCSQKVLTKEERTLYEKLGTANTYKISGEPIEIKYYKLGEVYATGDETLAEKYLEQEGIPEEIYNIASKLV